MDKTRQNIIIALLMVGIAILAYTLLLRGPASSIGGVISSSGLTPDEKAQMANEVRTALANKRYAINGIACSNFCRRRGRARR